MHNLQRLLLTWNDTSLYELVPLLIVATLLCVVAGVAGYRWVMLFFRYGKNAGNVEGPTGISGWLRRLLFPRDASSQQKLGDEVRKLRTLLMASDNEKAMLLEHQLRDQKRIVEQQREIEVLQGQLAEARRDLNSESDKLQGLTQHAKHLEKQLEEIMHELERIYANASERPLPGYSPSSTPPPAPFKPPEMFAAPQPAPAVTVSPPPETHDPEAEKLKDIFLAYQQKVKERRKA